MSKPGLHLKHFGFFLAFFLFIGCGKEDAPPTPPEPDPLQISVDTDITYQTIAGFGGANRMWGTRFLKPAEAQTAFGLGEDGLGLSLFRVRIASDEAEWPLILESVQAAQSHGVKILASPWSPPAELKSNNSDVGGNLPEENFEGFKGHLNSFISYMAANGVDIYAISIQNEPDISVSYESCDWTSSRMANFIKTYGPLIEGAKIAAPESFNFSQSFTNTLLFDAETAENFDIVAGHIYGGGLAPFPLAEQKGKEVWMTEYLLNLNVGQSGAPAWATYDEETKWAETLTMLNTVHQAMSNNWNAYIWWYLRRYYSFLGDGEQGTTNGEILKRGYAFSQFSKYVRPGFVRVETGINRSSDLQVTAYDGSDQVVVVVINPEATAVNKLNVKAPSVSSAAAYVTSLDKNREPATVELAGDTTAVLDILPESVTTIVIGK
ncbi:MAG: hypothetical protein KDD06_04750 [Phaeodactylibacter sp.]|nr:hypothetical protein [Phaeodactylibacter sp.]MCB9286664.1 cellulose-binding protein [Lewinellaceae bacterium]